MPQALVFLTIFYRIAKQSIKQDKIMANTNIDVNKQSVVDFLKSGKEHPFVIPEYQRPYAWGDDEITTLFDDLWDFSIERTKQGGAKTYFLGSIVSFENENEEREIIDGQQRITSLFLLLRAVYSKLENEENKSDEVLNFISKINPALWLENELTGKVDKSKILLRSDVATDQGNEILRSILEKGETQKGAKDNYSKNYNRFVELYAQKAADNTFHMFQFINALLNYSILLPITADNQDTALTIFSTLNNRGLPLSDADIFKSIIYKQLDVQEKKEFATMWKELEADAANYGETIQSLFYYQMFIMRAKEDDEKTTTPGVRKYFMAKDKHRLNVHVLAELEDNLKLWKVVKGHEVLDGENWSKNFNILKILDCLSSYTNEFWKYPVLIFYKTHKDKPEFENVFEKFLGKLCALLITRYLEAPSISAVKGDIMKLNAQITKSITPSFPAGFKNKIENAATNQYFISPHRNLVRMLLKVLAYDNAEQKELLPDKWEIEHIFPQKWDTSYFTISEEEANTKLEQLGNKIPLEKPINIKASNNYFAKKKVQYLSSKIAIAHDLGKSPSDSWLIDDIEKRNEQLSIQLTRIIDNWISNYNSLADAPKKPAPTAEQAEMIRQLKEAGLI